MKKSRKRVVDAVVVGAGPAGISASLQLCRHGLKPVLVEKDEIGGSLLNANLIENYPGFGAIRGRGLAALFRRQLESNGVEVVFSEVKKISHTVGGGFGLELDNGREIGSRAVIVASGTRPRKLGVKGEGLSGVFYEIRKMKKLPEGKNVVVIGGGDAAFDHALNLAARGNEVKILCRSEPKCLKVLGERAGMKKNIELITGTKVLELVKMGKGIRLLCEKDGLGRSLTCDFLLIAVGREPNTGILPSAHAPGLFLAGDVKRGPFRQVGIAVGDGLHAAMEAARYLRLGEK